LALDNACHRRNFAKLVAHKATNQQLASVAGMLMSISAAVYIVPLYTMTSHHAMDSSTGWDGAAGDFCLAQDDLQLWADHLKISTGKP